MASPEPKQITTEQMRALVENETGMSPASRRALIEGQCPYDDGRGNYVQAPPTFKEGDRPTHHMFATVNSVATFGADKCKLN